MLTQQPFRITPEDHERHDIAAKKMEDLMLMYRRYVSTEQRLEVLDADNTDSSEDEIPLSPTRPTTAEWARAHFKTTHKRKRRH